MFLLFLFVSGHQADRIRKDLIIMFTKEFQLSIACESNLKVLNFLDVTLDLTGGKYNPDNKPDNILLYINESPTQYYKELT